MNGTPRAAREVKVAAPWRLGKRTGAVAAVSVAFLFLATSFAAAQNAPASLAVSPGVSVAPGVTGTNAVVPAVFSHPTASITPAHRSSSPAFGPPSSGRGTFLNTSLVPLAPSAQCAHIYVSYCVNSSWDPSINYTSNGFLAVAYMDLTNQSPCASASPYAISEIGFTRSANLGATWSAPIHLGLTNCALADILPDAYQPTLTSLANGTLVLAYIAYNISSPYNPPWYQYLGIYNIYTLQGAALVLTESYDNGATWTSPQLLNESMNPSLNANAFTPQRPWVDAVGKTIYVAWENETQSASYNFTVYTKGAGSSQVHLLVSKDGGSTWGTPIDLPTIRSRDNVSMGENPSLLIAPSGKLYVTYLTNVTYYTIYPTNPCLSNCTYAVWTGDVVVGHSLTNGTNFTMVDASPHQFMDSYGYLQYRGIYGTDPSPQLGWNSRNGELYLTFSAFHGQTNPTCGTCGYSYYPTIYFANSANGGATWTAAHLVSNSLLDAGGAATYMPTFAVTPAGQIDLIAGYTNLNPAEVTCGGGGYYCPVEEIFLHSADNGTTFSNPVLVTDNRSGNDEGISSGWYSTATIANGKFFGAWPEKLGAAPPGSVLYFPGSPLDTQIAVSTLYSGPGVTLTFAVHGLQAGKAWGIDVMGNLFAAVAPASIVVTGVPPGEEIDWAVSNVAGAQYGVRYSPTSAPVPPSTFFGAATVNENYTEQVLLNIDTAPAGIACGANNYYYPSCWDSIYSYYTWYNYNVTPTVGPLWVPINSTQQLNVTPITNWCWSFGPTFCYVYSNWENLTFLSWTGSGLGSVNSLSPNITLKAIGPINESANFRLINICHDLNTGTFSSACTDVNQTMSFHETGLPMNTRWNVTVENSTGATETGTSNSTWLTITGPATLGVVNYTVWSSPSISPGRYWVGKGTPVSPIELPGNNVVNVSFSLQASFASTFPVQVNETGLPSGPVEWTLNVSGQSHALESPQVLLLTPAGTITVSAGDVLGTNGTGYYAASISVQPLLVGAPSYVNYSTVPASVPLSSPAFVTVVFQPEYRLTVAASSGGVASPSSEWVHHSGSVILNETPSAGFLFIGWTGVGPGSTTTATPNPTISPGGPVNEFATFRIAPPSTWTVNISASGLPAGATFSLVVGNQTYSGGASFNVSGLSTGNYLVSPLIAYLNGSSQTRYVGTITATSFAYASPGVVTIGQDGTLTVSFVAQYLVTFSAVGAGTISPSPGQTWENASTSITATATPSTGYVLSQWVGTGTGAVTSTSLQISPTANGPITETAQFVVRPTIPPATFALTVSETGLPGGTSWGFAAGTHGAAGSGASVTLSGLNGSYSVSVPVILAGYGTRYVATDAPTSNTSVSSNQTLTVAFQEQFLFQSTAANGGAVLPASGWMNAGTMLSLSATAKAGWQFSGWQGTGSAAYTGALASTLVTLSGPVNETAMFAPIYTPSHTTGSSTDGLPLALGLLLALIVVGLVVGFLLARGRSPPPAPPAQVAPEESPEQPPERGALPEWSEPEPVPASGPAWDESGQ